MPPKRKRGRKAFAIEVATEVATEELKLNKEAEEVAEMRLKRFAVPTGSDDALEAVCMEFAAKKMAHDEAAKELRKRSEARMQSIAAARRKVADSEAARQQAEAKAKDSEAARQQAESKAKADSQVLADLLADDCGTGELDARVKQLKTEMDIVLAKVKALSCGWDRE